MINSIQKKQSVLSSALLFLAALPVITFSLTSLAAEDTLSSTPNLHIRTLAASCAACHGTNGNAIPSGNALAGNAVLAGMDKNYFTAQMLAFKNGERQATVMHRHAKGLQVDEINQLAAYFSAQKPIGAIHPKSQILKPQTLKADHD